MNKDFNSIFASYIKFCAVIGYYYFFIACARRS